MPKRSDLRPTAYPGIHSTEGGHVVRVRTTDPRTGKPVDRPRFVPGNIREALRVQSELRAEVRNRGRVRRTRLRDYAASWLARKLPALSAATADRYAVSLDDHVLPELGDWYIDALTPDEIVAWRDRAAVKTYEVRKKVRDEATRKWIEVVVVKTYGARTVNGWLRVLRTLLDDACVELKVGPSPASRVKALPEPPAYTDENPNVLTADELGALLVALREVSPSFWPLLCTMAMTGLRASEATALKWSDREGQVITIQRSAVRGAIRERTKTQRVRRIPLAPLLIEVLDAQRAQLEEASRAAARDASIRAGRLVQPEPLSWMFPSEKATPRYGTTLARPLQRALKRAEIARKLTPHGLRRTMNDVLRLVASADVQKAITGHSTEAMRQHYAHITIADRAAAIGRVAEVVKLEQRRKG